MNIAPIKNIFIALAASYALVFIILLGANLLVFRSPDPTKYLPVIGGAAFYAGAFICAFAAARLAGENSAGFVMGAAAGIIYIGVIFLISLCFEGERNFVVRLLLNTAAILTAVGGSAAGCFKRRKKLSPAKSRAKARRRFMNSRGGV